MKNLAIVSGRGYGKTLLMGQIASPEAPTVAELQNATLIEGVTDMGVSFGPFDGNEPLYRAANYTAQMSFTRLYPDMFDSFRRAEEEAGKRRLAEQAGFDTWEDWINSYPLASYVSHGLGLWDYPPAEELMHRLNTRLQGKDPGLPVNTRYWRDQK